MTITSATPAIGPLGGAQVVTIVGTGFIAGAAVTFGGVAATVVNVISATQLTCVTPAHAVGRVSIVVTNSGGGATATLTNGYTYSAGQWLIHRVDFHQREEQSS